MKAILISFFNSNNIGDQLISAALYKMISPYYKVKCLDFSEHLNLKEKFNMPEKTNPKQKLSFFRFLLYKIKFNLKIKQYRSLIKKTDILFIGGGNMLFSHDKYSKLIYKFYKFTNIAINRKKIVYAISLGIGPFVNKRQERKAVEIIAKCNYISFRDFNSLNSYNKSVQIPKAYLSIDPVFFLDYNLKRIPNKAIGINIINNLLIEESSEQYEKLNQSYIKLIEAVKERINSKIYLFSTDLKDYPAINDIYSKLKNRDRIYIEIIEKKEDVINLYSRVNFLICTRMHAMIIAYTQFIPFIGLSWQVKVDAFFELINQKENKFDYKSIFKNLDLIISRSLRIIKNLEVEAERIQKNLEKLKNKYNIDNSLIKQIANKKAHQQR